MKGTFAITTCKFQEFGKVVFCHTKFLQAYLENNNMLKVALFINTVNTAWATNQIVSATLRLKQLMLTHFVIKLLIIIKALLSVTTEVSSQELMS